MIVYKKKNNLIFLSVTFFFLPFFLFAASSSDIVTRVSVTGTSTPATSTPISLPSPVIGDSGSGLVAYPSMSLVINILPMLNVGGFSYSFDLRRVFLTWKNPPLKTGDFVKILLSNKFYPLDAYDGTPIYQGTGEFYLNEEKLSGNNFYSIFVCNRDGVCSSGSSLIALEVLSSTEKKGGETEEEIKSIIPPALGDLLKEKIKNISLIQTGLEVEKFNGIFYINSLDVLRIGIEVTVPEDEIKTIIIKIKDKNDIDGLKTQFFASKWNKKTNRFEISNFYLGSGDYTSEIEIYDLNKKPIAKKSFNIISSEKKNEPPFSLYLFIIENITPIILVPIASFIIILFFIW